jgi:hypothetical protein
MHSCLCSGLEVLPGGSLTLLQSMVSVREKHGTRLRLLPKHGVSSQQALVKVNISPQPC